MENVGGSSVERLHSPLLRQHSLEDLVRVLGPGPGSGTWVHNIVHEWILL